MKAIKQQKAQPQESQPESNKNLGVSINPSF
jgi:hypothetical protein